MKFSLFAILTISLCSGLDLFHLNSEEYSTKERIDDIFQSISENADQAFKDVQECVAEIVAEVIMNSQVQDFIGTIDFWSEPQDVYFGEILDYDPGYEVTEGKLIRATDIHQEHGPIRFYNYKKFISYYEENPDQVMEFWEMPNEALSPFEKEIFDQSVAILDEPLFDTDYADIKLINLDTSRSLETKRAIICLSGYMSYKDNFKEQWHAVLDANEEDVVYGYLWPALDSSSIFDQLITDITTFNLEGVYKITIKDSLLFKTVKSLAAESGKLLAH